MNVVHHREDLRLPDVARTGHDPDQQRAPAAELLADRLIDLDEGMAGGQACLDVELGAQMAHAGGDQRPW